MSTFDQQSLSIMNYRTGNTYTWTIESGGGTLSANTGERVGYKAPGSNPDCTNNPTIRITDSQGHYEEFKIALTSYPYSEHMAYSDIIDEGCNSWGGYGAGGCMVCIHKNTYNCDGELLIEHGHNCSQCLPPSDCSCCYNKVDWWTQYKTVQEIIDESPKDLRSESQKQQGCCPEALFGWYEPKTELPDDLYLGKDPQMCIRGENRNFSISGEVGNPISVYDGNNIESEEDLHFASANRNHFVFKRYYNSRSNGSGAFGFGWTHNYCAVLNPFSAFEGERYLKIMDETGRGVYFKDVGGGIYEGAFKEQTTVRVEVETYVWQRKDGKRFVFNSQGQLAWTEDTAGNRITLSYSTEGELETIADTSSGRTITLHYNADNRVDYILGPVTPAVADGKWVRFAYDANGNLTSVLYADGCGFDYEYSDPKDVHNLTQKMDKQEHLLSTWRYDSQDRAIENFTPNGRGVIVNYLNKNEVQVTDAYGNTCTYEIWEVDGRRRITDIKGSQGCPGCGDDVVRIEYDRMLRVIEVEFNGGLIEQYDNFDSFSNAQTVKFAVGTPDEKTVTYTFHPEINLKLSRTEASLLGQGNNLTIWDYDNDGNQVPNENPTGLLSRKIDRGYTKDTSGAIVPYEYITAYTYNDKGQILSNNGPKFGSQDTLTATYDSTTGDLLSVGVPLVGTTTYSDYDPAGQVGRATDANGNITTFIYDGRGRIRNVINEADGGTTSFDYNSAGVIEKVTWPNSLKSDFIYDAAYGRLTRVLDSLGNYTYYGYDDQGNRTELSYNDVDGHRHFFKRYDYQGPAHRGKLWKEINPDNTYTEYSYDAAGNVQSVKDPADHTTYYDHDALNRLISVAQPGNVMTGYTYDRNNNLVSVTDAENHLTTCVYDDLGRLVSTTSPDSGSTSYAFDAAGNLIAKTDANDNTVTYTYDASNRLVGVHFPDHAQDITYVYDTGTNGKGRLTAMIDPSGIYTYAYDALGNLLSEEKTCDGKIYLTRYEYDKAGFLTGITYPTNRTVTYELDNVGRVNRVTSIKDGVTDVLAENINYLPFGPIQGFTYVNGTTVNYSFDLLYRLTDKSVGSLQDLSYALDSIGNITAVTDNMDPAKSQSFVYDDLHRLTSATGIYGTIGYTYDKVGNRLTQTFDGQTDTYVYTAGTSRLDQITGATNKRFSYDPNGNTTAAGQMSIIYNQNNRLIRAAKNNLVLGEYVYNGNGQRIKKTVSENTTMYHYDLFGNLIGESTPEGDSIAEYIYLNNIRLAAFIPEVFQEITVAVSSNIKGALFNVPVYAFTEAGSYTGKSAITDADGIAHFVLSDFSDGAYRFRADYLTSQFWSDVVTLSGEYSTTINIAEETAKIQVAQGGSAKEGVKVYLFNAAGAYLGIFGTTDENGEVIFDLPTGNDFKFRADILGNRFFSKTVTIVSGGANTYVIESGGGTLSLTVGEGEDKPLCDIPVYLFNVQGLYLGMGGQTDDFGRTSFEVPSGTYKFRADYLGYQFWSQEIDVTSDQSIALLIPHQDVILTFEGDYNGDVEERQAINVYLFAPSGAYLGQYRLTDAQGRVSFGLPEKDYKVRADYLSRQYWSEDFIWTDETVTIDEGMAEITVTNMGLPIEGVNIYVFNSIGMYLGINDISNAGGQVGFRLPTEDYNFRADYMGNQYWSGILTLIAHVSNPVHVSTGGGSFTLTVLKGPDDPLEGVNCYLFNESGAYLGEHRVTSDQGEAGLNLADGTYKIRIDYLGYQFWTEVFSVPETFTLTYTIPHQEVTVIADRDYNGDIVSEQGLKMYLFTPSNSYLGKYRVSDEQGRVTFNLPEKDYKVRADYLSQQYWSGIFNWTDETILINEGMGEVHLSQGMSPLENVNVYVFNDSGSYLGIYDQTDEYGVVAFRLPQANYKFRADYRGNQYWANEPVDAHQVSVINLNTGGGTFNLTLGKDTGIPLRNIPVYVFSASGTYLGMNSQTDDQGLVSFDLSEGDYKFRSDYLGYQFWSDVSNVPNSLSDVLNVPHQDVTIAVNEIYGFNVDPLENVRVYLFTSAGSYRGVLAISDDQGQVVFNLPHRDYKVRVDYLGSQYWSDVFNQQDINVDIKHGVANIHITLAGDDVFDAPVYLFAESGSYLGRYERTDEYGVATFTIPAKSYKFRVDYDGTQHWSSVINIIPHEENDIELELGLLSLDLTNDPNPVRKDGKPPEYEPERVLVASIGYLTDILVQSVITQTPARKVYYYVNDHLGMPLKMIDENGAVVWNADYKPFAEAAITVSGVENNFRFPGQYYDNETGLHYNYFRYYEPSTGRYLTPDPIGLVGMDPNLYGYAQNNPINAIDPEGLFAGSVLAKLTGRIVGQTAQEAALTGKLADSVIGATIGFGGNSIIPQKSPDYIKNTALGLQIWGTVQTVSLAKFSMAAASKAGPLGLSLVAGAEIGLLIDIIPVYESDENIGTWYGNFFWHLIHKPQHGPCD